MTDKVLYFLRHGQAESNANHFFAGQADVALTPLGIRQAEATAPLLAHLKFDRLFCSDLQRAKNTAALALPDQECEYTALIREISVGEIAYKTYTQCAEEYGERYWNARRMGEYSAFGGESRDQLKARAECFLQQIAALEDTPTVGAVCHGGFIRAAARVVLGDFNTLTMPDNCSVAKFSYRDGIWTLDKWNVTVEI